MDPKEFAGQPYQPTNGTGLDMMFAHCCEHCVHDKAFQEAVANDDPDYPDGCSILQRVAAEDMYHPPEWIYDDKGCPTCTAFVRDEGDDTHYKCPDLEHPDIFAEAKE